MTRKILHIDLDAFFCACEELEDPSLRGTPFAVGGSAEGRGVIASCSYAARALGIHSAMPAAQALRICPRLKMIHGRHTVYQARSKKVMEILRSFSPIVEQVSVDEAFLDISDMRESAEEVAHLLQRTIAEQTQLPCSLGCGSNKLIAKMANTIGKKRVKTLTYPRSVCCVPTGEEAAFLAPLPVGKLWGVGDQTEKRLKSLGIATIGQLAAYPVDPLRRFFGKYAEDLHEHANGRDNSPVRSEAEAPKSISQEVTFFRDISSEEELIASLLKQSEKVGRRLRKHGLKGNTVRIKLRWEDFTTITRQIRLTQATNRDSEIYKAGAELFRAAWQPECRPVRLLGLGVSGFESKNEQLSFLAEDENKEDRLLKTLDAIRARYGEDSIRRG